MKKLFFIIVVSLVFTKVVLAFPVKTDVFISHYQITSQVYNIYPRPIVCYQKVQGVTITKMNLWAVNQSVLFPGQYGYAYLYSSYPHAFIQGASFADCNWY
jgi:hypothetical protein